MKLETVPNIQDYQVDVENGVVYKMIYGRLKEVKPRTKYKKINLQVDGKYITTTLYRMMYCAINQIDIRKIPSDICISMDNGKLVVLSRSMLSKRTNEARKRYEERLERIKTNMRLIENYYKGDVKPMLDYLGKVEKSLVEYYTFIRGLSLERAEIVVGNAVNKYLDKLRDGVSSFAIRATIKRYAYGENTKIAKHRLFIENIIKN